MLHWLDRYIKQPVRQDTLPPPEWTEQMEELKQKFLAKSKTVLLEAPALALLDITKSFYLYVDKKEGKE